MNPSPSPGRTSHVLLLAKRPEPGRVKTRLVPPLTHDQAARVAAASLNDTMDALGALPQPHTLVFDGDPVGWLRDGWRHVAQQGDGLDERITHAFAAVDPSVPCVLVGMDTPQLTAAHLDAFDPSRFDACLGLAADGGFWALGFTRPGWATRAVPGVPMSTDHTGRTQLDRLRRLGLRVQLLDELVDVDDIDSARHVASLVPHSSFAATLSSVAA